MKVVTSRFGEIDIEMDKLINFPKGVLGFEQNRKYCLLNHDERGTLKWLQSVDNKDLAFMVVEPHFFFSDYSFILKEDFFPLINFDKEDEAGLVTLVMLSVHEGGKRITANLQAPIIMNRKNQTAVQVICDEPHLTPQHQVYPPLSQPLSAVSTQPSLQSSQPRSE